MIMYVTSVTSSIIILMTIYILLKVQDGFFNELIIWGYKFIFAPLLFSILNYYWVIHFEINKKYFMLSAIAFIPVAVIYAVQIIRESKESKSISILKKTAIPIIKQYLFEVELNVDEADITFNNSNTGNSKRERVIVNMPEKTEAYELLKLKLQSELRQRTSCPDLVLIFNYKYVYKKKNSSFKGSNITHELVPTEY
ncbi:hypothetical protein [Paenibacillus glycanilyticus]|uniref:Uncharacterized protein n=1 Tax=Paenibacillus glycanilyticus TaxID=126569 RepID=A0ABQ6G8F9_9BACL|nr:hypothetical protein [Paenibacillus glycanilyticus]GLX67249.1 hypothetical protein MU1_15940 [Paenibacillus glycanilyticus]